MSCGGGVGGWCDVMTDTGKQHAPGNGFHILFYFRSDQKKLLYIVYVSLLFLMGMLRFLWQWKIDRDHRSAILPDRFLFTS